MCGVGEEGGVIGYGEGGMGSFLRDVLGWRKKVFQSVRGVFGWGMEAFGAGRDGE
jgi:hypothetical protein